MGGGVLDGRQREVDLKSLGEELGTRVSDVVPGDAANEEGTRLSAAADTFQIGKVWGGRRTSALRASC